MFFRKKCGLGGAGKTGRVIRRSVRRTHLLEQLETRQLLAVAPVTRDDTGYYTPVDTNLIVTTSSAHLLANDIDFDGGTRTVSIVTAPTNGTILSSGNDGSFTYQPNNGYSGFDRFEYRINDGTQNSNVAQAVIAVGGKLLGASNLSSIGRTTEDQ